MQGPYSEWFVMRDWFDGEECDVQNITHIEETVRTLARLHQVLVGVELTEQEREFCLQPKLKDLLERRNRELRRVRTYIRGKKQKSAFEQRFLQQFSELYEQAERATGLLMEQEYEAYYDSVVSAGVMLHGNYTHHSILFDREETVVTGFQKTALGIQVHDFYLFFRKMMEKWDWNVTLGERMLSAYEEIRPIPEQERKLLYLLLSYPEKFWKVANQYYNNRKSWVPEKNMQKLVQTFSQAGRKEETIQRLFT